jgi:hypothetical protein
MRFHFLALLLMVGLTGAISDSTPKPPRAHCTCGDICAKAAPADRCLIDSCDGKMDQ